MCSHSLGISKKATNNGSFFTYFSFYLFEKLKHIDITLLHTINQKWSNQYTDAIIPWLRYQEVWYPFYVFLLVFALLNFGKRAIGWIVAFIITVSLTDSISSRLVKNAFQRLRPCNDPDILPLIDLKVPHCSGGFSFTSTHATNHFGMAMFIYLTIYPILGKKTAWIFLWPALVSYAQVYVGVHYPFDILGGAFLGCVIGWITGKYLNKRWPVSL